MATCPACDHTIDAGVHFCIDCGEQLSPELRKQAVNDAKTAAYAKMYDNQVEAAEAHETLSTDASYEDSVRGRLASVSIPKGYTIRMPGSFGDFGNSSYVTQTSPGTPPQRKPGAKLAGSGYITADFPEFIEMTRPSDGGTVDVSSLGTNAIKWSETTKTTASVDTKPMKKEREEIIDRIAEKFNGTSRKVRGR